MQDLINNKINQAKIMIKRLLAITVVAVLGFLSLQACAQEKESKSDTNRIAAEQFQQQLQKQPGVIIDVRTQEEFDWGHLAVADYHLNLLNGNFETSLDSLGKDKTYYLYCRSGNRSGKAAKLMGQNGFKNVYNIGGYQELVSAGLKPSK